jgi:sugar lactone lactonase YvrE
MIQAELIIDAKSVLGEGAIWDFEKKVLYWVDITSKKVHVYNPLTQTNTSISLEYMPGNVVPRKNGGLLLALENGLHFLDEATGGLEFIDNPESHLTGNIYNDGKCDPTGRFWFGSVSRNYDIQGAGSLYTIDNKFKITKKLAGLTIANGIAWSLDNKYMYYIDTLAYEVWSFKYDPESGKIWDKKIAVSIPEIEGWPDGMTIDKEGMIWVALFGGWKVVRYNPLDGTKMEEILLPVSNVTSCAFGGENLDELYITTARHGLDEEQLINQPLAGGVFMAKPGIKGIPCCKFSG